MRTHRLHQVAQGVQDLGRATAFYRDVLGLRHVATYDPPGLAFFDLGGTRLLLEKGAPAALLYVEVGDVEEAWEALSGTGAGPKSPPHLVHRDDDGTFGDAGVEEWMAFFEDSEGNLIAFVERRAGG